MENVNIRASALTEFWGDEFKDSIYLWESAKHNLPLEEIENNEVSSFKDIYSTQPEIEKRHKFCKSFYYKMLPILTDKLNKIHGLNLSQSFWQISFGYWLYRHISATYEKYEYLSQLDINKTGIKLLNKNDFYVPNNHYDYVLCFSRDFGAQQLVSLYYYFFAEKQFQVVNKEFPIVPIDFTNIPRGDANIEKEVAFVGLYLSTNVYNYLYYNSQGRIGNVSLPINDKIKNEVDYSLREIISGNEVERNYDSYFLQSLYHCMPKDYIENFREYYDAFQKDIQSKSFKYIVTESWISQIPSAIYAATAKENNRKLICYEHGAGAAIYKNWPYFIDMEVSDFFLSVGWQEPKSNFVKGGFAARDIIPYSFDPVKKAVLYISRTKFIYWMEFNEACAGNSTFVKELRMTIDFIDYLTPELKENFMFRPRKDIFFWDTESTLQLDKRNVRIDNNADFAASVSQSKIVVIDHISTGFSELLLMNVPFILLHDIDFIPLPEELIPVFDELVECGVVHKTSKSAAEHLESIYDNVQEWWTSAKVQSTLKKLKDFSLAPASNVTNFLISLLNKNGFPQSITSDHKKANNLVHKSTGAISQLEAEREKIEKEIESNIQKTLDQINGLIEDSQIAKAKEAINKILTYKPDHLDALNYLAVVNICEKNYFQAELILNAILQKGNSFEMAEENLAALADLKSELNTRIESTVETNNRIAMTEEFIYSGKFNEAENLLNQILNKDSENIDALNNLIVIKILQRKYSEAKELLFHILKIDKENEKALENMKYLVEIMNEETMNAIESN